MKDFDKQRHWERLSIDSTEFVFGEAEKYLSETIETAKVLTDRAINVFQFSLPLSIASIVLLLSDRNADKLLRHLCIIGLITCLLISWKCLKVYRLYQTMPHGNLPSNLLNEDKLNFPAAEQRKIFLQNALVTIQNSIEFNLNENKRRSRDVHHILEFMKWGAVTAIAYTILWYPVFQSLFA
jgi:hypothetical protein